MRKNYSSDKNVEPPFRTSCGMIYLLRPPAVQDKPITDEEKGKSSPMHVLYLFDRRSPECLQSLYFTEMDARHQNIKQPLSETCGWLFQHPDYQDWYMKGRGLLLGSRMRFMYILNAKV